MTKTDLTLTSMLNTYNIQATPARLKILKIVINITDNQFTRRDVFEAVKDKEHLISEAVVNTTLRLFKARRIIQEVPFEQNLTPGKKYHERGRPQIKFIRMV
jgi:Fe2+ or Zn2+ uptake regulation protein